MLGNRRSAQILGVPQKVENNNAAPVLENTLTIDDANANSILSANWQIAMTTIPN